jgi:hypothetical protein
MEASTSASSTDAYRYGWETYANQVVSEILKMSHEERKESIDQLRLACASTDSPFRSSEIGPWIFS